MSSVSARTVFKFCMIPWVYKTLFSIIVYTPTEIQLDQTVIFFSEHSMKLYAVVEREKKRIPSFLLYCSQYILFGFLHRFPLLLFLFIQNEIKMSSLLPQSLLCKLLDFESEGKYHSAAFIPFISSFSFFSSLGVMPSQKRNKKTPFFSNT